MVKTSGQQHIEKKNQNKFCYLTLNDKIIYIYLYNYYFISFSDLAYSQLNVSKSISEFY